MTNEQINLMIKRVEALENQHVLLLRKSNDFLSLADGFHTCINRMDGDFQNKLIDIITTIEDLRREVDSLK